MESRTRQILKNNGILTTVITGALIIISILLIIGGLLLWASFKKQIDEAQGAEALAMVFVLIIILGVVLIMEIVAVIALIFGIVGLFFGIFLLCSKNIEYKALKKRKGILIAINVFIYILFVLMIVATIFLIASKQYVLGAVTFLIAAALMVAAIFQSKNIRELNKIVKSMKEETIETCN